MSGHTYDKISITAKLVAYFRQFSDIAYARDVADFVHAEDALREIVRNLGEVGDDVAMPQEGKIYAPLLEARYKSIMALIREFGAEQVLELASGLSLRGLAMATGSEMEYVESDLPALNEEKRHLLRALTAKYGLAHGGNHSVVDANALEYAELEAAVAGLNKSRALVVVNEGLIPYLSMDELRSLAVAVRKLIGGFGAGSLWITPDFTFKEHEASVPERVMRFRRALFGVTTRELHAAAFEDEKQLDECMRQCGFEPERFNMFEKAGDLTSPQALGIGEEIISRLRARMSVWVLRPVSQAQ